MDFRKCLKYLDMLHKYTHYDLDVLLHALNKLKMNEHITQVIIDDDKLCGFVVSYKDECNFMVLNKVISLEKNDFIIQLQVDIQMSAKNKLQEVCHKLEYAQPTYTLVEHVKNADNTHEFTSVCQVGGLITQGFGNTKKGSQIDAATQMLELCEAQLKLRREEIYNIRYSNHSPVFFIDIENCPWAATANWTSKNRVFTFMSTYSHHYTNRHIYDRFSCVCAIDSHGVDAADIYMTYFAGRLIQRHSYTYSGDVVLISSDRFVGTLKDIINNEDCANAIIIKSFDELNTYLSKN